MPTTSFQCSSRSSGQLMSTSWSQACKQAFFAGFFAESWPLYRNRLRNTCQLLLTSAALRSCEASSTEEMTTTRSSAPGTASTIRIRHPVVSLICKGHALTFGAGSGNAKCRVIWRCAVLLQVRSGRCHQPHSSLPMLLT